MSVMFQGKKIYAFMGYDRQVTLIANPDIWASCTQIQEKSVLPCQIPLILLFNHNLQHSWKELFLRSGEYDPRKSNAMEKGGPRSGPGLLYHT